jgi:SAM-dependent methyltransferase
MPVLCSTCGKAMPCPEGHVGGVDISGTQLTWLKSQHLQITPDKCLALMNELIGMEIVSTDMEIDEDYHGYRPYPIGKLGYLLDKILDDVDDGRDLRFLEIGCGPGTKIYFAIKAFGLHAYGFDIDPKWTHDAHEFLAARGIALDVLGQPRVWREDAEDFEDAADYDIVFLNRPLRNYDRESQLEQHIAASMKNGTYLVLGNGLTIPAGWKFISQDIVAQAYKKVCACEGIEEFLELHSDGDYGNNILAWAICTRCGRTING